MADDVGNSGMEQMIPLINKLQVIELKIKFNYSHDYDNFTLFSICGYEGNNYFIKNIDFRMPSNKLDKN